SLLARAGVVAGLRVGSHRRDGVRAQSPGFIHHDVVLLTLHGGEHDIPIPRRVRVCDEEKDVSSGRLPHLPGEACVVRADQRDGAPPGGRSGRGAGVWRPGAPSAAGGAPRGLLPVRSDPRVRLGRTAAGSRSKAATMREMSAVTPQIPRITMRYTRRARESPPGRLAGRRCSHHSGAPMSRRVSAARSVLREVPSLPGAGVSASSAATTRIPAPAAAAPRPTPATTWPYTSRTAWSPARSEERRVGK